MLSRNDKPDPMLDALLDEALRPEKPPADLEQRILAATRPLLASHRQPTVIGRIGPGIDRLVIGLAAMIVLAAGLTLALRPTGQLIIPTPHTTILAVSEVETELAQLAELPEFDSILDREIELLRLELDLVASSEIVIADPARELFEWESHLDWTDQLF